MIENTSPLLEVKDLVIHLQTRQGIVPGVNALEFCIQPGETVCLTGESGAGKTLTTLAILGLLPENTLQCSGSIRYQSMELLSTPPSYRKQLRGKEIGVVFQDPANALNPVMKIGDQLSEIFRMEYQFPRAQALQAAVDLLQRVGIDQAQRVIKQYPYQLSGGMQQRILIAIAISQNPKLLIADEPTTSLDATLQAQIVELIQQLKEEQGLTVLWITHDLTLAARVADRTVIMYGGKTMEIAPTRELLDQPHHPYTRGLINSMPQFALRQAQPLIPIKGIYHPQENSKQCVFFSRCDQAKPSCKQAQPPLKSINSQHQSACWYHGGVV